MKTGLKGFSLIEIMIVMALIGLIMAGIAVAVFGQREKGQRMAAETEAAGLAQKLAIYKAERRKSPQTWDDLVKNGDLERPPVDPWGHEYRFICPGIHHKTGCDVMSNGPDEQQDTEDDIGNWEK